MIVMQAIGRALALEPYLATIVLSGGLFRLEAVKRFAARLSRRSLRAN